MHLTYTIKHRGPWQLRHVCNQGENLTPHIFCAKHSGSESYSEKKKQERNEKNERWPLRSFTFKVIHLFPWSSHNKDIQSAWYQFCKNTVVSCVHPYQIHCEYIEKRDRNVAYFIYFLFSFAEGQDFWMHLKWSDRNDVIQSERQTGPFFFSLRAFSTL